MATHETLAKPFVKYVGGKTKLLPKLKEYFPKEINNYYEPFVGGGSVLFELLNKNLIKGKVCISDINLTLIDTYVLIRDNVDALILELGKENTYKNTNETYYENRKRYNQIKDSNENSDKVEKCALFIYLNKCGFNGMYRENAKGEYNIPFGKQKNPAILDTNTLKAVSKSLKGIDIVWGNYTLIKDVISKGDFVYIDSPYDETFTDYTQNKFGKTQQRELKEFVDYLDSEGVRVMLSNSKTENVQELYRDYNVHDIETKYFLNSKGNSRKDIKYEVIITNYEP
jgi:DNA adenine methylase